MTKIGRNEPCPCGKRRPNGLALQYKKCCESDVIIGKKKLITITRKDFISEPYTQCPNCKTNSLGVHFLNTSKTSFSKECYECGHKVDYPLPSIRKKVIYLDQFVIDNIVKTLDKKHYRHSHAITEPFWLELYKKLDTLSKAQLIVCPDSFYHQEESASTDYFESMKRIYEHLSGGVTFYPVEKIIEKQITHVFRSFIKGQEPSEPDKDPQSIAFEDMHVWHTPMRISVGGKPRHELHKMALEEKENKYGLFLNVFERWKTEKQRNFDDWYTEELNGFGKGTILALRKFHEKRLAIPEKVANGEEINLFDMFPTPSVELWEVMCHVAKEEGLTDDMGIAEQIGKFFISKDFGKIHAVRIGALIYAMFAKRASNGQNPPSKGVHIDTDAISGFLPYCDAIFVDRENGNLLNEKDVQARIGVGAKIFSMKNKEEFLNYLDEILEGMSPEHLSFVESYYGEKWRSPYTTILEHSI